MSPNRSSNNENIFQRIPKVFLWNFLYFWMHSNQSITLLTCHSSSIAFLGALCKSGFTGFLKHYKSSRYISSTTYIYHCLFYPILLLWFENIHNILSGQSFLLTWNLHILIPLADPSKNTLDTNICDTR